MNAGWGHMNATLVVGDWEFAGEEYRRRHSLTRHAALELPMID